MCFALYLVMVHSSLLCDQFGFISRVSGFLLAHLVSHHISSTVIDCLTLIPFSCLVNLTSFSIIKPV